MNTNSIQEEALIECTIVNNLGVNLQVSNSSATSGRWGTNPVSPITTDPSGVLAFTCSGDWAGGWVTYSLPNSWGTLAIMFHVLPWNLINPEYDCSNTTWFYALLQDMAGGSNIYVEVSNYDVNSDLTNPNIYPIITINQQS